MYHEQELIYLYHLGSQIAFELLLQIYKQKYRNYCQKYYLDTSEMTTEDYVQIAMIAFYKSLDSYRFDMNTQVQTYFMHVLAMSLRATTRSLHRKKHIPHDKLMSIYDNHSEKMICQILPSSMITANQPDIQYSLKEEIKDYQYALLNKTSKLERIIFDYYNKGYKASEIAALLNIDIKTVYNANYRIQKKMAKLK